MGNFSFKHHQDHVHRLANESFDLLIIGGGITGAGAALQAAASGLKVALIDRQDFAEGSSSRSTKMVHGGISYLKQFDIDVVQNTVRERKIIKTIAPHIPTPQPMLLPLYDEEDPSAFTPTQLRVAMDLYDRMAKVGEESPYKNQSLTKEEVIEREPQLSDIHLIGGGVYLDYTASDSRLVLENLKSAVAEGALVVSRVRALGFEYKEGQISAVLAKDTLSNADFSIQAKKVLNATGPWADEIRELDRRSDLKAEIYPTKGVHLVVSRDRLSVNDPVYIDSGEGDGRMIFVIPVGDKTYFGSSSTPYAGDLDKPTVEAEDVDYLINAINRRFEFANLRPDDVVASWAGIRPDLQRGQGGPAASRSKLSDETFSELIDLFNRFSRHEINRYQFEDAILSIDWIAEAPDEVGHAQRSRSSDLLVSETGLYSIIGGRLTQYREMAEEAVSQIIEDLNEEGGNFDLVNSKTYKISGGDFDVADYDSVLEDHVRLGVDQGLTADDAEILARVYGTNTPAVLAKQADVQAYVDRGLPQALALSLAYALEEEYVFSAMDYFARRTDLFFFQLDFVLDHLEVAADMIKDYHGLSSFEAERQINEVKEAARKSRLEDLF